MHFKITEIPIDAHPLGLLENPDLEPGLREAVEKALREPTLFEGNWSLPALLVNSLALLLLLIVTAFASEQVLRRRTRGRQPKATSA